MPNLDVWTCPGSVTSAIVLLFSNIFTNANLYVVMVSHYNAKRGSVLDPEFDVGTFGLVIECWTDMLEVIGSRLSGVTTFGVRSIGSYTENSMTLSI